MLIGKLLNTLVESCSLSPYRGTTPSRIRTAFRAMASFWTTCRVFTLAWLLNLVPAAPVTNDSSSPHYPEVPILTEPEDIVIQDSGLQDVDPHFTLSVRYGSNTPIMPLSAFMTAVESLGILATLPFNDMQPAHEFSFQEYRDASIVISGGELGTDLPLPRKYVIWGMQQGLYQIGLRGLQNIYTLAIFTLKYDGNLVGTVAFLPPLLLNATIQATGEGAQVVQDPPGSVSRRGIERKTIDERASLIPSNLTLEDPNEQYSQSLDLEWEPHLKAEFALTQLSMPAYFNAFSWGLSQVAEHEVDSRVVDYDFHVDTLQIRMYVENYGGAPRPRPPYFTYRWAAYGLVQSAREGAQRVRNNVPLTQMVGVVGLSQPGSRTRIKVGQVSLFKSPD